MSSHTDYRDQICELTVIIPAGKPPSNFDNLEKSLSNAKKFKVKFIIIHEIHEKSKVEELIQLKIKYPTLAIEILDGNFGSPGLTRNKGIDNLNTKFVYFADCDDEFHIESIMNAIKVASHCDVIIGKFQVYDLKTKKLYQDSARELNLFSVGINPGLWRIVFRSDLIKHQLFSNLQIGEDQLFLAKIRLFDRRIYYCESIFYTYYRNNPHSLTSQTTALIDLSIAYKEMKQTISQNMTENNYFVLICLSRLMLTRIKHEGVVKSISIIVDYLVVIAKQPYLWPRLILIWFKLLLYVVRKK